MMLVKKLGLLLLACFMTVALVSPVLAQTKQDTTTTHVTADRFAGAFSTPAWGAGLGAGMVIIGASIGFGRIGAAALESMARQPETAGRVQTAMIIIGALLEGVTFFALVICFIIGGKA
jgi:F-type H+-transporting ATPase subunit c